MDTAAPNQQLPKWFWIVAGLGLAWNIFGVVQFLGTFGATRDSLMRGGMTPVQAELYAQLPLWMTASFAIGVFCGVAGSLLLLVHRRAAVPVFGASLLAYCVLYIGDITQGVFAAFGTPQVAILTTVVLIAIALLWLALRFQSRGALK